MRLRLSVDYFQSIDRWIVCGVTDTGGLVLIRGFHTEDEAQAHLKELAE